MSKQLSILAVLLLLTLQADAFAGKPVQDPYFVKMKGFKVLSFNTSKIEFASTAVFYNTYNNRAKLQEVDIDVYVEDKYIGKVTNAEDIPVNKLSAFDVPLLLTLEPPGPAVRDALWQGSRLMYGKKLKIRYAGHIKLKVLGFLPIKVRIDDDLYYSMYAN